LGIDERTTLSLEATPKYEVGAIEAAMAQAAINIMFLCIKPSRVRRERRGGTISPSLIPPHF